MHKNLKILQKPASQWQLAGELFPPLSKNILEELDFFPEILEKVRPLKKAHKEVLPQDIAALSRILTSERGNLSLPYWHKPAFISAYLYYFLPWNLLRLCALLGNLKLPDPCGEFKVEAEINKRTHSDAQIKKADPLFPLLIDIGSGPLTFILALWLMKPEWRGLPIHCIAVDKSGQPLEIGRKIFYEMANFHKQKPWKIELCRQSLSQYTLPKNYTANGQLWLASFVNVLNELEIKTKEKKDFPEEDVLAGWFDYFQFIKINDASRILFVEPGTRRGGNLIQKIRLWAVENELTPESPCTHSQECPLYKSHNTINKNQTKRQHSSYDNSWCHFTFAVPHGPKWLLDLSKLSGLTKQALSLSFLLLSFENDFKIGNISSHNPAFVRIISHVFKTGYNENCRYGCAGNKLVLLPNSKNLYSGSLVKAQLTKEIDEKSGAVIVEPVD